ncbi:dynein axonemal heavy chain 1 [Uranotaenia lowii]|uniref:dynein axonemal heavy chain 1 n=1 Tax=Uranotaenia lowii TaxID=190385 RepID=UPI002479EE03|nr:dynein axonemal heavy chain 1 [Uranotaenia lowii]
MTSVKSFLPLEWFDNYEFDSRSEIKWLSIPNLRAYALVNGPNLNGYEWQEVYVLDYDYRSYLWTVINVEGSWEVPRIRLFMVCENASQFVERIKHALESRKYSENFLRFSYLLQLVNVYEYFELPDAIQNRVRKRYDENIVQHLKDIFRQYHIGLSLNVCLLENGWLNIVPVKISNKMKKPYMENKLRQLYDYKTSFALIKRIFLYSSYDVFAAMMAVHVECEIVRNMMMFDLPTEAPITLATFKENNNFQLTVSMDYLQNTWIEQTTMKVYENLLKTGRGWFDVFVNDWAIFRFTKLFRFIEQARQRMQIALRDLVLSSTKAYLHRLCDPCVLALKVQEDYVWDGNLIDSPFDVGKPAVFYLLLEMAEDAPFYSTSPNEFLPTLLTLFDEAVINSHKIPIIDPAMFGSLIYAPRLCLSSIGLKSEQIGKWRDHVELAYQKVIIPLNGYAARYAEFSELFFTNVVEYVKEIKETKTSLQVKEEISFQIRMRESLERTVPMSIVIGSFWIDVKPLRTALIDKRLELTDALLVMLTERLRDKTTEILTEYKSIMDDMCQKPVSIEHIVEIREFMEKVPDLVFDLEDRMKTVIFEYEILDFFRYALPDGDFYQKWDALAYPQSILKQIDKVHEFHEGEVDKFRKQQVGDEAGFAGRVESLNVYISKFTTIYDIHKVNEISIETKKLWKQLVELVEYGHTLNLRQELFESPPIDLSSLLELQEGFVSYKSLWTLAADYVNVEESWRENPLSSVEVETVQKMINHYRDSLGELVPQFDEQPQIKEVAKRFIDRIESFEKHLEFIVLLQHPLLEPVHWNQLAKAAGIKVKISLTSSFDHFLEHGIDKYQGALREVIQRAEEQKEELERKKAEEEELKRIEMEYRRKREARRLKRTEI